VTQTVQQIRELVELEGLVSGLESISAKDWMRIDYSRYLYGGWKHPDGRWIERGHVKAQAFHEACKQFMCPKCWAVIGYMGTSMDNILHCRSCDLDVPLVGPDGIAAGVYDLLFISGGNQSSKSFTGITEFCSWIEGSRPWDGSLTCTVDEPGLWLLCGPTHTTHFPDTLSPYFEERLAHRIKRRHKDANGSIKRYDLDNGDQVVCVSYEQFLRAGKQSTAAVEGPRYKGAFLDEPPPEGMFTGIIRGLMKWKAMGWGRCIIAATALHHEYLFNRIKGQSWNVGGPKRSYFSIEFTYEDNPFLDDRSRRSLEDACSPEEREVRLFGRSRSLSGRVYSAFSPETHTYSQQEFDPLVDENGDPSDWPVTMACDPHDVRPFAMSWCATAPNGDKFYFANWPEEHYQDMRRSTLSFTDYADIIREIEERIPGGPDRVTERFLDPKFGRTKKAGMVVESVEAAFDDLGLYFTTDFNPDVATGHAVVREGLRIDTTRPVDAINRPKIWVSRDCQNIIWSLMNYTRKPDADPSAAPSAQVQDAGKDFCDTVRFIEVASVGYQSWTARPARTHQRFAARKSWGSFWGK